jgi:hypothetical protein
MISASRPRQLCFIDRMIVRVIRRVDLRTERLVVLTAVAVVILVRSAIFVFWEQAHFDSDQAVIGLMAKQLGDGRAFPMFLYGSNYIFAVEAWMAAPIFRVFGASVAMLKLPLLAINIAAGLLLVRLLEREGDLPPRYAAVASVFFILPPPGTTTMLLEASGVNVEPFLYTILLWMTRRHPAWFGAIFAVGFLQREFIVYALVALVIVAAATGALFTRDAARRAAIATCTAMAVWATVALLRPYSSAAGPGTSLTDMRATSNVQEAMGRVCFDPGATFEGLKTLIGVHWMRLFGLRVEPLLNFSIDSTVSEGVRGAWVLLAAAAGLALARIVASVINTRGVPRRQYFSLYLTLVGVTSGAAFVLLRCGAVGPLRYALLSIFAAVGVSAWYLQIERNPRLRIGFVGLVTAWALVSAIGHGRLWTEYATHPPVGGKRQLVKALEARGVRYGIADYWDAYAISFLTQERIIMKAEGFPRIYQYDREVEAHIGEAVRISRTPCTGGEMAVPGRYLCPP